MNWYKLADRKDYLINKMGLDPQIVEWAYNLSSQINKKASYTQWLAQLATKDDITMGEDDSKIVETLKVYDSAKNKKDFPDELKNVFNFKSFNNFYSRVAPYLGIKSVREKREESEMEGVELIYNQDGIQVYKITNIETSVKLCKGTNWCVKDPKYAANYLNEGPLYLFIKNGMKIALMHLPTHSFKNTDDNMIDPETAVLLYPAAKYILEMNDISLDDSLSGDLSTIKNAHSEIKNFQSLSPLYMKNDDDIFLKDELFNKLNTNISLLHYIDKRFLSDEKFFKHINNIVRENINHDVFSYNNLPDVLKTDDIQNIVVETIKKSLRDEDFNKIFGYSQWAFIEDLSRYFPSEIVSRLESDSEFQKLWEKFVIDEINEFLGGKDRQSDLYEYIPELQAIGSILRKNQNNSEYSSLLKKFKDLWKNALKNKYQYGIVTKVPQFLYSDPEIYELARNAYARYEANNIVQRNSLSDFNRILRRKKEKSEDYKDKLRNWYNSIYIPVEKYREGDDVKIIEPEEAFPYIVPKLFWKDEKFDDLIFKHMLEQDVNNLRDLPEKYRERSDFKQVLYDVLHKLFTSDMSLNNLYHALDDDVLQYVDEFGLEEEYVQWFINMTFSNYRFPDNIPNFIKERPTLLRMVQDAILAWLGREKSFPLVNKSADIMRKIFQEYQIDENDPRAMNILKPQIINWITHGEKAWQYLSESQKKDPDIYNAQINVLAKNLLNLKENIQSGLNKFQEEGKILYTLGPYFQKVESIRNSLIKHSELSSHPEIQRLMNEIEILKQQYSNFIQQPNTAYSRTWYKRF